MSKDDAQSIKDREIYFSIVVADCNNLANRFPIEPYISQEPASEFNFPITGDFLIAEGSIPDQDFGGFASPCVSLQGGSYFFGKLESESIPLKKTSILP